MIDRLVIVVPDYQLNPTRDMLMELAVSEWEQTIHLAGAPSRRGAGQAARSEAQRILRLTDDFGADCVIVTKEICCEQRVLANRQDIDVRRPSVGLLRKRILKDELDIRGLRWRRVLQDRLAHWDSRKSDLDTWLDQFEVFGGRWVGETILRQLDIITADELTRAFEIPAQARLGANYVFTFIQDKDPASSSNRIGAMLAACRTRVSG
jgi:hypothetical protein